MSVLACDRTRDRGSATVTALVLMLTFTTVAVVWLARDVDRSLSNRSAAQSIAFQAARSGAQAVDVRWARSGAGGPVVVDEQAAVRAARMTAERLLDSYGLPGRVIRVTVAGDHVTVVVEVSDPQRTVSGTGIARAEERG